MYKSRKIWITNPYLTSINNYQLRAIFVSSTPWSILKKIPDVASFYP